MPSSQDFILSPLDQHGPKVYTRMALVFPITDYDPAIAILQCALAKTCDQIPYLKGRVFEMGESERKQSFVTLNTSDPAPRFQERPAPSGIPAYAELKWNRTPFPPEVFPSPILPGGGTNGAPVIAGSFTRIEGGLVVCVVTYHKVIDGTGYSEILRLLAENARNIEGDSTISTHVPDPDELSKRRGLLLGGKADLPEDLRNLNFEAMLARHPEYTLKSKFTKEKSNGVVGTPKAGTGTNKVFAFSGKKLDAVKFALADKLPSQFLTVNNILTAIIWTAITHIRATRPGEPLLAKTSRMDYSVSGRRLLGAPLLDPPFLGNAIGYAMTELSISEIAFTASPDTVDTLVPIISTIANASEHLSVPHIASLIRLSDTNPDLSDIVASWLLNGPEDLHFTSWAQVEVYGLDFGGKIGRPGFMRSAFMKFDGVVTMLPRRRVKDSGEEEEIEVSILLKEPDMERLSEDKSWRTWLVEEV